MATQYPLHYIEFIQKLSVFFMLNSLSIYAKPLLKQLPTNFNQTQLDLLQQSYNALHKPILDQIRLVIDANGISSDFSQSYISLISNCLPQTSAYLRKAGNGEINCGLSPIIMPIIMKLPKRISTKP